MPGPMFFSVRQRDVRHFHATPYKVIESDNVRSATYDFLSVIRSNYGLSRTEWLCDKRRFRMKNATFSYSVHLTLWY